MIILKLLLLAVGIGGTVSGVGLLGWALKNVLAGDPEVERKRSEARTRLLALHNEISGVLDSFEESLRSRITDNVYWSRGGDSAYAAQLEAEIDAAIKKGMTNLRTDLSKSTRDVDAGSA